jgi:hypothetical protein
VHRLLAQNISAGNGPKWSNGPSPQG